MSLVMSHGRHDHHLDKISSTIDVIQGSQELSLVPNGIAAATKRQSIDSSMRMLPNMIEYVKSAQARIDGLIPKINSDTSGPTREVRRYHFIGASLTKSTI
jgi:hypothetical protein